jgi:hypothetical protein
MKIVKCVVVCLLAAGIALVASCSQGANSNVAANATNTASSNTASSTNANMGAPPASANTKTDGSISLATPTDAYKTAYDCRKRKDVECLKKVMSKDVQDFLVMMGEDEKKSLDDMLKELCDRPQAPTNESRGEKITGNTATLEYPDEKGEWHSMDFEKTDAGWQMSAPGGGPKSPDGKTKKP